MNYRVTINKPFEQVLTDIEKSAEKHHFRVLHIHNVSQTLAEKGFDLERYSIVELCNAKFAHVILTNNRDYGSILPCKILVYEKDNNVYVSTPQPSLMVEKLGLEEIKPIAAEVEKIIKEIILEISE